ncbi:hypothetical protein SFUMM280S_02448 [Streptomyces fumanus]
MSRRRRGSGSSSTSRNFSGPQSATRNFSRARLRQPGPVAVVTEDRQHALVDVRDLLQRHPRAPSRTPSLGLVDSPPPTQTSKPGPCSGCRTPTKATSLISCTTSSTGDPEIAVLNLRGGSYALLFSTQRCVCPSSAGVPSMISSSAMPATGEPIIARGVSPHAVTVERPTASSLCQISGTSSIRIQWYCTFCRWVM